MKVTRDYGTKTGLWLKKIFKRITLIPGMPALMWNNMDKNAEGMIAAITDLKILESRISYLQLKLDKTNTKGDNALAGKILSYNSRQVTKS